LTFCAVKVRSTRARIVTIRSINTYSIIFTRVWVAWALKLKTVYILLNKKFIGQIGL